MKIRFINIMYVLAIIVADILVYIALGLLLMGYDDNWDSSKGEYWSWSSMNSNERLKYGCYITWNIINIIAGICFIRKIYRKFINNGVKHQLAQINQSK